MNINMQSWSIYTLTTSLSFIFVRKQNNTKIPYHVLQLLPKIFAQVKLLLGLPMELVEDQTSHMMYGIKIP
jgi:hypothetical protein